MAYPPWTPQQQYKFTGILNNPRERHQSLSFYVLAGVGSPTPTGGWAKVNTVDRARRKGFTQVAGYDPVSMDVPIRFEAMVNYGQFGWTPGQIERNIKILEWMAGRGKLYANGTAAQGNPPIVQIGSYAAGSQTSSNLIPPNFHSDGVHDHLRWLISNLTYDPNAIRGPGGDRHRQDVTVSVTEYSASPGAPASPRVRQQGRGNANSFQTFTTTTVVDTIAMVCIKHGIKHAAKWRDVVAFNQARLKVVGYNKKLKPGTQVRIPHSIKRDD